MFCEIRDTSFQRENTLKLDVRFLRTEAWIPISITGISISDSISCLIKGVSFGDEIGSLMLLYDINGRARIWISAIAHGGLATSLNTSANCCNESD